MTKGILQSIKQKNVLYRRFIRTKDLTKRELLLQNFNIYKNTIHKLISQITTSTILKNTETTLKNPGMALDRLSALIRQTHKQIRSIIINNKTESNSKIMAEAFNNFLVIT